MVELLTNIIYIAMVTMSTVIVAKQIYKIVKNYEDINKSVENLRIELNNSINCSRKDINNLHKRVQDQNKRLIILEHASQK